MSALKGHEETVPGNVWSVKEALLKEGVQRTAVIVDGRTGAIIDGHHRVSALQEIGAEFACVLEIDFLRDRRFVSVSWGNGRPFPKDAVIESALKGEKFPPKTTKNLFSEGENVFHVSFLGEGANCPLSELGKTEGRKKGDE